MRDLRIIHKYGQIVGYFEEIISRGIDDSEASLPISKHSKRKLMEEKQKCNFLNFQLRDQLLFYFCRKYARSQLRFPKFSSQAWEQLLAHSRVSSLFSKKLFFRITALKNLTKNLFKVTIDLVKRKKARKRPIFGSRLLWKLSSSFKKCGF